MKWQNKWMWNNNSCDTAEANKYKSAMCSLSTSTKLEQARSTENVVFWKWKHCWKSALLKAYKQTQKCNSWLGGSGEPRWMKQQHCWQQCNFFILLFLFQTEQWWHEELFPSVLKQYFYVTLSLWAGKPKYHLMNSIRRQYNSFKRYFTCSQCAATSSGYNSVKKAVITIILKWLHPPLNAVPNCSLSSFYLITTHHTVWYLYMCGSCCRKAVIWK